jgi:hypothetical protein
MLGAGTEWLMRVLHELSTEPDPIGACARAVAAIIRVEVSN